MTASSHAQTISGQIVGTISDSAGGVVPGVTLTLRNRNTGQQKQTISDDVGNYLFAFVPAGTYAIEAELSGFKKVVFDPIVIEVQQVARINFKLEVGEITDRIVVSGATPLLQSESSTVGQVITHREIVELPLNGRNFLELTALVPGAVYGAPASQAGRQGGVRGQTAINIHGARAAGNTYLLDGTVNMDPDFNTYVINPSIDVIQEFKLQTSNYSAEFGGVAGGHFNIITKSGTNDFHGTLYEFHRNAALDARNFFDRSNRKIPQFIQNQYGATIGGPISLPRLYSGKDRTFFFFGWEGLRVVQAQTRVSTVPTPAMLKGDFSSLSAKIYDPLSYNATTRTRQLFPGNVIPSQRISSQASALLKYWSPPNLSGTVRPDGQVINNYLSNESRNQINDQFNVRVDHQLKPSSNIFVRYSISDEIAFTPGPFPLSGGVLDIRAQSVAIGNTTTFTPSTVNEFRFGFMRFVNASLPELQEDIAGMVGIQGVSQAKVDLGIPGIGVLGLTGLGAPTPTVSRDNTFQFTNNLSINRGKHYFKLGGTIQRIQYNRYFNLAPRGSFAFQGNFTSLDGSLAASAGGSGFADFLLGLPFFSDRQVGDAQGYMRLTSWSGYVNDDWKLTPTFTLNLGLRYEYTPPPFDKYDFVFNALGVEPQKPIVFRPGPGDITQGMSPGQIVALRGMENNGIKFVRDDRYGRYPIAPDRNDFAPRIGFAWQPSDRWVIRSGYGFFYDGDFLNIYWDLIRNPPRVVRTQTTQDPVRPSVSLANAFPSVGGVPLFPIINAVGEENRTPYIQQWNLNIQREFANGILVELGYVGSKGTKLSRIVILNNAPPGPGAVQERRPNPQFGWLAPFLNELNSNYHGAELKIEKRLSHGLSFLSSYTWSKAIDNGSRSRQGGSLEQDRAQDETHCRQSCERGRASYNPTHNYAFNFVYELPFGKERRWGSGVNRIAGSLIEGWQVGAIYTQRTGFPFSALLSGDNSGTGGQRERADVVDFAHIQLPSSQRSPEKWFNTAAFALPKRYTFSNSGRNIIPGPGFTNVDLSAAKTSRIKENIRVQFRAEFFNLFNHPNFATPGNTFNSPAFGSISATANQARQIQFALKVIF